MPTNSKLLLSIFGVIALLNLTAVAFQLPTLNFITKPLLLISLSLYFFFATKNNATAYRKYILIGLIFSIGGDSFLMFEGYFVPGLGCFLITQICYIIAFIQFPNFKKGLLFHSPYHILPLVAYWVFLIQFLWSDLGDFQIPVLIYSIVITLMAIACLNMKGRVAVPIFRILFIGVLLFVFSDSVIAINKFKNSQLSIPYSSLVIMFTYIVAQYSIATSSVKLLEAEN